MGVPLLLTWLRRRFADCFLPADSAVTDYIRQSTDNLYIDLNSFLYQAATIITATHRSHRFSSVDEVEDVVLRKLFDLLDDLVLNLVQPKALVYIAVDGVSPLGKMSQQRARRRRGGARKTPSASAPSSFHHHHEPSGNMGDLWDGNCISVGTRFMAKVTEALHFYAVSRAERINTKRLRAAKARVEAGDAPTPLTSADSKDDNDDDVSSPSSFSSINIIVDDVLRPGEGENKIAEFIRRIRADPGYGPNTSHVICSSDTDVTVTSLILHEPRIHVLRYEPPVALGGKPPMKPQPPQQQQHHHRSMSRSAYSPRGAGGGGPRRFDGRGYPSRGNGPPRPAAAHHSTAPSASSPPPPKDSWLSTFFSIHVFRQRLREILLLAPEAEGGTTTSTCAPAPATAVAEEEDAGLVFERTLHDVVFVLLLFGNDFLPTIGGSIQEGTLDALLTLLATDFVPRGRTLVDPNTNRIQYASARYLLSCLAELPHSKATAGTGSRLHVHSGEAGDAMEWGFTTASETKERDAAFVERQQRREKQHERMCYCYWTMLQWALQYSVGIVEHWGCYYPYGRAPPLTKLATYCGVLTYEALGEIARRRLEVGASTAGRGDRPEAATSGGPNEDDEEEDDGIDGLPASALAASGNGSSGGAVVDAAERGRPTDVMVQLLILIPPRSAALLPTVFRHHYREVEEAVQAPVEQLNLASIGAWCEEKKRSLSEEERTRFTAYQFFASNANLGSDETPFPAHDIAFSAYWSPAEVDAELEALRSEKKRLANASASANTSASGGASVASASAAAPTWGLQSKAASFFSQGRRPALHALGSVASSPLAASASASVGGAAALLANVNLAIAPASSPSPPAPPTTENSAAPGNADAPAEVAATPLPPLTPPPPLTATAAAVDMMKAKPAALLPTQLRHPKGDYILWSAPCEALPDPLLVKALGTIQGNRFFAGSYTPLVDQDAVLSRGGGPRQDVRLQFRLVVVPVITDVTYAARLLPGYVEPAEVGMQARVRAAQQAEADRTDPWKQMDKLQAMRDERKRTRGDGDVEDMEEEETEESTTEAKKEEEVAASAAPSGETANTAITTTATTTITEDGETTAVVAAAAAVDSEAAELQRRKEEARRRLAALKAARLAAQEGN